MLTGARITGQRSGLSQASVAEQTIGGSAYAAFCGQML